jgi:peptide/nickel transport system permease protein
LLRVLLRKLWQILPVLALVSLGSFFLLELVPGDPAVTVLGPNASPAEYEEVRTQLGLDVPVAERYVNWVGDVVKGDLGQSIFPPNNQVSDMIKQRLPVTVEVALLSLLLSLVIAVPLAMRTAYRSSDAIDRVATMGAFTAISTPPFLAALLFVFFAIFNRRIVEVGVIVVGALVAAYLGRTNLQRLRDLPPGSDRGRATQVTVVSFVLPLLVGVLVAVFLPDFPRQGYARLTEEGLAANLKSVALPVLTLTLTETAVFLRVLRSDLINTLTEDYILAARAKGMPGWRIMLRDALRPSLFSLITLISVTIGRLLGGSVIVEIIFNLPGMGRMIIDAISTKDYPIVQASVLMIGVVYVLASALIDVLYHYLDPRLRRA